MIEFAMKKSKVVFIFQTHRTLENQEKVIAVYI